MNAPLITHLSKNKKVNNLFPATDENAKIVLTKDDSDDVLTLKADTVECADKLNGKNTVITTGIDLPEKKQWIVCVTDTRITFWTSWSRGWFGLKTQQKLGNALGGHLHFDDIIIMNIDFKYKSLLSVGFQCLRYDMNMSTIIVRSDSIEDLKKLCIAVHERLTKRTKEISAYGGSRAENWKKFSEFDWKSEVAFPSPRVHGRAVASHEWQPPFEEYVVP